MVKIDVAQFGELCTDATIRELQKLRRRVDGHVRTIEEAALSAPDLPVDLARQLADRLHTLIDSEDELSAEARRIIHGTLRYFILTTDDENDLGGPNGLDDDVAVLNEACGLLGRDDLKLAR